MSNYGVRTKITESRVKGVWKKTRRKSMSICGTRPTRWAPLLESDTAYPVYGVYNEDIMLEKKLLIKKKNDLYKHVCVCVRVCVRRSR